MNICMPVKEDKGLESRLCEHFGSAPLFLIVDSETRQSRTVPNRKLEHEHGACRPLDGLGREALNCLIVAGIGRGAVVKLQHAGIEVLLSPPVTAAEALAAFLAGTLQRATLDSACGHHGHGGAGGHGCGHGPQHGRMD